MRSILLLIIFFSLLSYKVNAQSELWGMTQLGGDFSGGVIFKTENDGENQEIVFSFNSNCGSNPQYTKLCEASNGKLYGMTQWGGTYDMGVIFEYDIYTHKYSRLFDFDGVVSGKYPDGSLCLASNGKLYGMTSGGGVNDLGVLFEYDISSGIFMKKVDFDGTNNGANPHGSLIEASNGKLYGMTYYGGSSNKGVLFEFSPGSGTYTKKIDFNGTNCGSYPYGSLAKGPGSFLYGMTSSGGQNGKGVIFYFYYTNSSYAIKVNFNGASNGSKPRG
ncbi:MAG: choice-of-anchor tandem repeat GloVer-containing protein, partial [Bacteroidota bacterium]